MSFDDVFKFLGEHRKVRARWAVRQTRLPTTTTLDARPYNVWTREAHAHYELLADRHYRELYYMKYGLRSRHKDRTVRAVVQLPDVRTGVSESAKRRQGGDELRAPHLQPSAPDDGAFVYDI